MRLRVSYRGEGGPEIDNKDFSAVVGHRGFEYGDLGFKSRRWRFSALSRFLVQPAICEVSYGLADESALCLSLLGAIDQEGGERCDVLGLWGVLSL
jgi:hypothetical protein